LPLQLVPEGRIYAKGRMAKEEGTKKGPKCNGCRYGKVEWKQKRRGKVL